MAQGEYSSTCVVLVKAVHYHSLSRLHKKCRAILSRDHKAQWNMPIDMFESPRLYGQLSK